MNKGKKIKEIHIAQVMLLLIMEMMAIDILMEESKVKDLYKVKLYKLQLILQIELFHGVYQVQLEQLTLMLFWEITPEN